MSKSSNSKPIDHSQTVVKDLHHLEAYHSQRLEFTALPGDETGDSNKPPKLTRTQSMKIAASAAADHLKEHKHKYSTCAIVSTAAIIVGCVLGVVAAVVASKGGPNALDKELAASKGTSFKPVSPIPAKGSGSSRRRMMSVQSSFGILTSFMRKFGFMDTGAIPPSEFELLSDYNLMLEPSYVVDDPAAEPVNMVNTISCYIDQLQTKDMLVHNKSFIAMVDPKLCGEEGQMMEWAVHSKGPDGMGDGEYQSDFIFMLGGEGGAMLMNAMLKNVVTGGELKTSKLSWQNPGFKGFINIDYYNSNGQTEVSYAQGDDNGVDEYLKAVYDEATSTGAARTMMDGVEYVLKYSDSAIIRRKIENSQTHDVCLAFTEDDRILTGDQYNLFSASDGSKLEFESGFVIQKEVVGFEEPVQAYASNWGIWPFWTLDENGTFVDPSEHIIINNLEVEKVNYDGPNTEYTLEIVPARLSKIENHRLPLRDLKDLPLVLKSEFWRDERVISWDGEKFRTLSTFTSRCVYEKITGEIYAQYPFKMAAGVGVSSDKECYCLDITDESTTGATIRNNGAEYNYYNTETKTLVYQQGYIPDEIISQIFAQDIEKTLEIPTVFVIDPSKYPYGMSVSTRTGSLNGRINIEFESIQTLYGVKRSKYTKGDAVTQESTGATGEVYSSTSIRLFGFTCNNCMTYTDKKDRWSWSTCAPEQGVPQSTSFLRRGFKLTQGSAVGYVIEESTNPNWEGFSIEVESGTFNLDSDITVSLPTSDIPSSLSWYGSISGTLTKPDPSANSLSQSYNDVVIDGKDADCGDAIYAQFDVTVSGVTGAVVDIGYSKGYGFYGWVSNPGSNCNSASLNVQVTSGSCPKPPTVQVFCANSIRDTAESVIVKLPSPSAKKFKGSYFGGDDDTGYDVKVKGSSIGSPYWVNDNNGKMIPISDDTLLTYTTYSTVNPGENVPELICYENCPGPESPKNWNNCKLDECNVKQRPSHLADKVQLDDGGKCITSSLADKFKLPSISFENIGGQPNISATWDYSIDGSDYNWYVSFLALMDPGMDCKNFPDPTPELVFDDTQGICESLPQATITCQIGNDYSDFRQANKYSFDSMTGILSDSSDNEALIGPTNERYDYYESANFGPFYAFDDTTKTNLICDYNEKEVCAWKAWSSLETLYYYSTGPGSQRVTLVKEDGKSISFAETMTLTYTHEGDESNSGKNYDGVTTMLTYDGPGQLYGLPQLCMEKATQKKSDVCVPEGAADETINIDDISIPDDVVITDLDGKEYYAKAQVMLERYPVSNDPTICSGLDINSGIPTAPTLDEFTPPANYGEPFPTPDELASSYLNGGKPAVVKGVVMI